MTTARLAALADGVFAIVMTLLVFDLRPPEAISDGVLRWAELYPLWPNFLSYVISFVILGVYWVGHHNQFYFIRAADARLMWLNILFLMCVSLVPFSAGLLGRVGVQQVSVVIYGLNLIATSLAHYWTWHYATAQRRLVDANLGQDVVQLGTRLSLIPPVVYGLALGVSFFSSEISLLLYALVPIPYVSGLFTSRLTASSQG